MADIAALTFTVDASQLADATKAMAELAAATERFSIALERVQKIAAKPIQLEVSSIIDELNRAAKDGRRIIT